MSFNTPESNTNNRSQLVSKVHYQQREKVGQRTAYRGLHKKRKAKLEKDGLSDTPSKPARKPSKTAPR